MLIGKSSFSVSFNFSLFEKLAIAILPESSAPILGHIDDANDELFYGLYDEFNGHTYYVQAVLNRIYGYNTEPNQQSVQRAIIEIIREWEYSYQTLLSASSPTSVRLLKAIAREKKVTYINAGEFISAHKLKAASSVNRALKSLIDKELVYHDKDGYSVYDRFMAIWLRSQSF